MNEKIGADSFYLAINQQREGPFTYEEVLSKLEKSEIHRETLAWQAGLAEWQKLSSFGIFPMEQSQAEIPPILDSSFPSTLEWLQNSFQKTKLHWGTILLSGLVYLAIEGVFEVPMQLLTTFIDQETIKAHWKSLQALEWPMLVAGMIFIFLVLFVLNYVKTLVSVGYQRYILAVIRGESDPWGRMIEGLKGSFLSLLLYLTVATMIILLGFCCFLLPGIYFAVCYSFAPLFIVDQKLSFWEAMETSRRQVHQKWFRVFWYLIVIGFVLFSGVILLVVGLLFTLPMGLLCYLMIYENLLKEEKKAPALSQAMKGYPEVWAANLCVFPGLGTWLAGKTVPGIVQMSGAFIGALMTTYGIAVAFRQWGLLPEGKEWFGVSKQGLIYFVVGLIVIKFFWLWGLWSAWSYKKEIEAKEGDGNRVMEKE